MAQFEGGENDPIRQGHNIWLDVARTADASTLESILCDDVVLMPPNDMSLFGKSEVVEWFNEYFANFLIATLTPMNREVFVADDVAIESWNYMVAIAPVDGSDRIRDDGRFLMVWKKQDDGVWKISHCIWNSMRPIGSGTSRFLALMKKRPIEAGTGGL